MMTMMVMMYSQKVKQETWYCQHFPFCAYICLAFYQEVGFYLYLQQEGRIPAVCLAFVQDDVVAGVAYTDGRDARVVKQADEV